MNSPRFFSNILFFLLFLLFLLVSTGYVFVKSENALPIYRQVPKFELTDQSGKTFSSDQLKGRVWIANFIFTRCQGMCPLMSGKIMNLQKQLKNPEIQFVSFSVDPEYDSPKILSEYAKRFHAKENQWVFLTGEKSKIWELVSDGFMLGVDEASPEDLAAGAEPVMHSSRFVLVDKEGKIRGFFDSSESVKMNELVESVQKLSKQ